MKRHLTAALALAVTTAFAIPAMANQGTFPMQATEFKQKVDARMAKARARMEKKIQKRSLTPEKASERRAKFDAAAAGVTAQVQKATADGTVTEAEAKAVREAARQLRKGHHKRSGCDGSKTKA